MSTKHGKDIEPALQTISATLSHWFSNDGIRPISFSPRTLNKAKLNYSTIHKEALPIMIRNMLPIFTSATVYFANSPHYRW